MSEPEIRPISAAETRPLRQAILRPHQRVQDVGFPGDEIAGALHVGAFIGGRIVSTATVHPEPKPGSVATNDWRLRGMATLPEARRKGCGAALVRACIAHAKAHGGARIWCHAREGARAFYEVLGFVVEGERVVLPEIGPHFLMWIALE